jgi:hypothetical protein
MAVSYRAEFDVLRLGSTAPLDRARLTDLVQTEPLDWPWIARAAIFHRVHPFLHRALQNIEASLVPDAVLERLAAVTHAAAARNLFGLDELNRVLGRLNTEGVRALSFKGPVLSYVAYGDERVRDSADLDILVSPQDIETVDRLLRRENYRRLNSDSSPTHRRIRFFFEKEHHYARGELAFNLDVHTAAVKPGLGRWVPFQTLYDRAQTVQIDGCSFTTLSVEDSLQLLCFHGAKDRWVRLRRICDVNALVHRHPHLDWDAVLRRAHASRCERMLCLGLYLANRVFSLTLPGSIMHVIERHPSITKWGDLLAERLPRRCDELKWGSLAKRMTYPLAIQDTLGRKMRYATYAGIGKLIRRIT